MLPALHHSTYWCVRTYFHASFRSSNLQDHYSLAQIWLKTAKEFKNHSRYMDRQTKVCTHDHVSLFS